MKSETKKTKTNPTSKTYFVKASDFEKDQPA